MSPRLQAPTPPAHELGHDGRGNQPGTLWVVAQASWPAFPHTHRLCAAGAARYLAERVDNEPGTLLGEPVRRQAEPL